MFLDDFEPSWRIFLKRQADKARVLVVDDEPNVGRFLTHALRGPGYSVTVAHSAAEAWVKIESEPFDLILVDKNMPEEDGLTLLQRLRESGHDIPTLLLIGEVSPEAIDEALRLGAVDYLAKPVINVEHLVRRIGSVLDRRLSHLLFDPMFSDLKIAMLAGTGSSEKYTKLSRSLLTLKEHLGRRPACALIDPVPARLEKRVYDMRQRGIITLAVPPELVSQTFDVASPPLVAAISIEGEEALPLIQQLHQRHPELLIFAISDKANVRNALRAVDGGASDYALTREEGWTIVCKRLERMVTESRRQALYLGMATLLHSAARETRPDLANDIIFAEGSDA